jgi:hypothetical protein
MADAIMQIFLLLSFGYCIIYTPPQHSTFPTILAWRSIFSHYAPTNRMRPVFKESRLESVTPIVRLHVEEEYNLYILEVNKTMYF